MSKGLLSKKMALEYSPFLKSHKNILILECFSRLMDGISPWLSLPDDDTKEGNIRKELRKLAILSYKNAVKPNTSDMILWHSNKISQPLVEAGFLAQSFLRAPDIWNQLDIITKNRYLDCFKEIRKIKPPFNNCLLFIGIVECFFMEIDYFPDKERIFNITNQINRWYIGDGWYSDGKYFSMNYYNSYVIHPMFIDMLEIMEKHNMKVPINSTIAIRRMQRYNIFLERLISPEGTFPAFGRSIIYRLAAFHSLAVSILKYGLPEPLTNGQVRSGLTKIICNMFNITENFNNKGFLNLGFVGHQVNIANSYSTSGSTYLTSLIFLPLGLPSNHSFWVDPPQLWTSKKAWTGKQFPIDNHI